MRELEEVRVLSESLRNDKPDYTWERTQSGKKWKKRIPELIKYLTHPLARQLIESSNRRADAIPLPRNGFCKKVESLCARAREESKLHQEIMQVQSVSSLMSFRCDFKRLKNYIRPTCCIERQTRGALQLARAGPLVIYDLAYELTTEKKNNNNEEEQPTT